MPCAGTLWNDGDDPTPSSSDSPEIKDMDSLKIQAVEAACRKITRREATWRRMLVSQPPPPSLGYLKMEDTEDRSQFLARPYWVQTTLIHPEEIGFKSPGLRMGTLYDIV
ncbi:hypothetical protein F5Y16DRAFT_182249 [Xylariaceae sp. FL0255]|nr:hypothetical protein F5Y16DRAFT_182249 [Xylariaceae sp. FL0255]